MSLEGTPNLDGTWDCRNYDILDAVLEGHTQSYRKNSVLGSEFYANLSIARVLDVGALYDVVDARDYNSAVWHLPPPTEFLQASWSFCEHVYSNVSVNLGLLHVGNVTTNALNPVPDITLDHTVLHSTSTGINYTIDTRNGEWSENSLSELFGAHLGGTRTPLHETHPTYSRSDSSVISCLKGDDDGITLTKYYEVFKPSDSMKSLTHYLRTADVKALTDDLADALTARIRNTKMGGNANLTMFAGDAFVDEVYITVQWPWMILPVMETVLAGAALAFTIGLTRQQALLKGSTLPLLMQRMDGWSPEETSVRRLDTKEGLRERVKDMVARLDEGQDGELIFKRECRR